jgi:hypothetical protein
MAASSGSSRGPGAKPNGRRGATTTCHRNPDPPELDNDEPCGPAVSGPRFASAVSFRQVEHEDRTHDCSKERTMIRSRWVLGLALLGSLGLALVVLPPVFASGPNAPVLNVKLGLWEATAISQVSGMPPIDMSNMTPEQRARVEAALEASRKRGGVPHTFRTCLTKEKLGEMPFQDRRGGGCKQTVVTSSPTTYDVKFACDGEDTGISNGEWRFEAASPELVKGSGQFTMERGGHKMESTSNMTAKWVGASCGDVR